ncbi:hypothetical protein DFJ74DRAFT_773614 [Hyaloraphidium curvatum]|nr:hypothetical protein DFJ74DRAFT_773614 [Hyaloraphidium curvatum]
MAPLVAQQPLAAAAGVPPPTGPDSRTDGKVHFVPVREWGGREIAVEVVGGRGGPAPAVAYAAGLAGRHSAGDTEFRRTGGGEAPYRRKPAPPLRLIASHGLRGRRSDLLALLALVLSWHPAALFDARGHGDSAAGWIGPKQDAFTWPAIAGDIAAVADWADAQPGVALPDARGPSPGGPRGNVVMVGKSMTAAATLHALVHPKSAQRFAGAVLFKVPTTGPGREDRANQLLAEAPSQPPPLDQVLRGVARSDLPPNSSLPLVPPVPLLILTPTNDPLHPRESAETVFAEVLRGRREAGCKEGGEVGTMGGTEWKRACGVELHAAESGEGMEGVFAGVLDSWLRGVVEARAGRGESWAR